MTGTNDEIIQAVFKATPAAKAHALAILQGRVVPASQSKDTASGPLLLSMSEAAELLGVSRVTLWRMIRDGKLSKIQVYQNVYRLRRSDILALVSRKGAARG